MNLYSIHLEHLSYLEANQFITLLFKDIDSVKVDLTKDTEMNNSFQTLKSQSDTFYKAIVQIRAMAQSKELEALDLDRDRKISTIRLYVAAFRYRNEPDIKNAFAAAGIILDKFQRLQALNYEAESTGIQKFLDEWNQPENAAYVETLELELHLSNLKNAADAFDDAFHSRSSITTSKEVFNAKVLKSNMFKTYSSLAKYIVAMVEFKKDETLYPPLLNALNNGRKYFSDLVAKRKGGKEEITPEDTGAAK